MAKKHKGVVLKLILGVLIFLAFLAFFSAKWYIDVYGDIGFDAILFTLFSSLNGVEPVLIIKYLLFAMLPTVLCVTATCLILFLLLPWIISFKKGKHERGSGESRKITRIIQAVIAVPLSIVLIIVSADKVALTDYVNGLINQTTIYKDSFVDPKTVSITFPDKKQNLIFILMESMEMTFTSEEYGGVMEKNLIPELCNLAKENVNFSSTDTVGGGISANGSTWTIGAMVAQTAGIPLKLPSAIDGNSYGEYGSFLPGATALSDILHSNDYYQALMVGSDAEFGGRSNFYSEHGTDKIYDIYTAKKDGVVAEDYWVWWGMEDLYLYQYAKQALADISSMDKPFAFTMLTVDTHHIGGYKCKNCKTEYSENYSNVISCADRQLVDFIDWLKTQSFYENTTIVISGDHPSMDSEYIMSHTDTTYQRRIYNCFINSKVDAVKSKNREFVTMDMFPTILASMGCVIEGDRLGLGTNLFSERETLSEEMGLSNFMLELSKAASYYDNNILN